jgi:hypothetical protein
LENRPRGDAKSPLAEIRFSIIMIDQGRYIHQENPWCTGPDETLQKSMRKVQLKTCLYTALCVSAAPCLVAAEQHYDTSSANGLTAGNSIWDSGTTAAWADSATPGINAPGVWLDGNDAIFQTGGTSSVTLSGSVNAASLTHASGTTTLTGNGTLTLSNGVILSGGTLHIGEGTAGSLPDGCTITMSTGTFLNFGRSDAASWSGRINGAATTDGTVSKTGTGDFMLTLQGANSFGTIRNSNTTGQLTIATAAATDEINTTIRSVENSAMAITSGTWNTPNLGQNNTGAQMRGKLAIANATVTATTSGRYVTGNYQIQSGGALRITTDRFSYNSEQSVASATLEILTGGLMEVYSTQFGSAVGGGNTQNLTAIIKQSGGIARFGVANGANTSNRNLLIGAKASGSKSAYDLSGGTLLVAGTISGDNALNNLIFRGGTLAANAITTTKLGYSTDVDDPVANSTSVGTLVNRGGTLAPGDIGTTGKTTITGAYQVNSGSLAIDIGGTTAASAFQGASSQFDNVAVSGAATLGGSLDVTLRGGFNPATTDSFTILTAGSIGGTFSNLAGGSRIACSPAGSFLVTVNATSVVLSDYQNGSRPGPVITHAPVSTGATEGYGVTLSVTVGSSSGNVTYQWQKDGVAIDGATGAYLSLNDLTLADAGSYDVVVTDALGGTTSSLATLTVAASGSIDPLVAASAYASQSVWSYHSDTPVSWSLFKPRDYGSSRITFDGTGVTPLGRVPASGVHPRIFFSPEDLPAIRDRIQNTTGGQEAWKNLLSYTHWMKRTYNKDQDYAKPWWYVNHFGYTGRNPHLYRFTGSSYSEDFYTILANGGTPASFASTPSSFFKIFSMEALRCLIENDTVGGRKLAAATVRAIQLEQARRATADAANNPPKPSTPRADCSALGLVYDFTYNFMTPAQQDFVRQELVMLSSWQDNYGTFNNAEASRSNWATFSYWVFDLMAIEGEPGFNDLKFLGLYRGWRNLFTYGFFDSGAFFEGEGKVPLGFDAIMAFDRVGWKYGLDPLAHHPTVRSYYSKFIPYSTTPARDGKFVIFDILGGITGSLTTPADLVVAKYFYQNDPMVDFSYRSLIGDDYRKLPSAIHFLWNEQALSTLTATTWNPANDLVALNTPLSFFCGQRAMMMTRSSWDSEASLLTMHVRGASGGHPYPDRNGIMFYGKGRPWFTIPGSNLGGWAMNTVLIDEAQQSETTPARVVDHVDQPQATFMVGDAKYSWDWVWARATADRQGGTISRDDVLNHNVNTGATGWSLVENTFNDFAYEQSIRPVFQRPMKFSASWIEMDGILEPFKRMVNTPVLKSFRSAGLIRGPRPYALVVDDIQRDAMNAIYDWNATLPSDVVQVTTGAPGQPGDVILVGSASLNADGTLKANEPALLVRVLESKGALATPSLVTRSSFKHFQIRTTAVAPDFKILVHAFRMGETLPTTTWNSGNTQVNISFPDQSDTITFTPAASGKTDIVVNRGGSAIASVTQPVQPFVDPATDAFSPNLLSIQTRVNQLQSQGYNPTALSGFLAAWEFNQTQQLDGVGPAYLPVTGSIPAAAPIPAGNSTLVTGMHGDLAASLAAPGLTTPLSWNSQLRNAFTISFWIKMNTIENDKVYFHFGDHRTLGIRQRGGSLNLFALSDWYKDAGPSSMMTSWTHLVAVFNGSQLQIHRNGHLVSAYAATSANFNAFLNMQIGATTGTNGAVQSVHFYNRNFSSAEIQDLFLWGKFGPSNTGPVHTPLESWRLSHFGTAENSGTAADTFDHDNDGLANLAEYALGGDPTSAIDAPRPIMIMTDDIPKMLRFSFSRMRDELTYTVEASADLTRWDPIDANPGNIGEMVTVETPAAGDRRFLRLRITQ